VRRPSPAMPPSVLRYHRRRKALTCQDYSVRRLHLCCSARAMHVRRRIESVMNIRRSRLISVIVGAGDRRAGGVPLSGVSAGAPPHRSQLTGSASSGADRPRVLPMQDLEWRPRVHRVALRRSPSRRPYAIQVYDDELMVVVTTFVAAQKACRPPT
jgi:hypothetical protein